MRAKCILTYRTRQFAIVAAHRDRRNVLRRSSATIVVRSTSAAPRTMPDRAVGRGSVSHRSARTVASRRHQRSSPRRRRPGAARSRSRISNAVTVRAAATCCKFHNASVSRSPRAGSARRRVRTHRHGSIAFGDLRQHLGYGHGHRAILTFDVCRSPRSVVGGTFRSGLRRACGRHQPFGIARRSQPGTLQVLVNGVLVGARKISVATRGKRKRSTSRCRSRIRGRSIE